MTDAAAPLVWMATETADDKQSYALASWSHAHGVLLSGPRGDEPTPLAMDGSVAEGVEELLDRTREALSARDPEAVDLALASAESLLRAHPQLPQAAWLMAEVERGRAARFRRLQPIDDEAVCRASSRADALDGGRVGALGEESSSPPAASAPVAFNPGPGEPLTWLWVDGVRFPLNIIALRPGLHAIVVMNAGAPVWADWVETGMANSIVRVAEGRPAPCSRADLARARVIVGATALDIDASAVRCGRWVAALPARKPDSPAPNSSGDTLGGAVLVAQCGAGGCGALIDWSAPTPATWGPLLEREHAERPAGGWPTWATSSVAVAAVVFAAGLAVLASGALHSAPGATRFVGGGLKTQ